jgi:hypothetical protein
MHPPSIVIIHGVLAGNRLVLSGLSAAEIKNADHILKVCAAPVTARYRGFHLVTWASIAD